jgi:predicted RNA polymerase sigma factor
MAVLAKSFEPYLRAANPLSRTVQTYLEAVTQAARYLEAAGIPREAAAWRTIASAHPGIIRSRRSSARKVPCENKVTGEASWRNAPPISSPEDLTKYLNIG